MLESPWLPVYLLMSGLMHPLLGAVAALGALCLAALAWLTERLTRADTDLLLQASRDTQRRAETLARHAEVIAGMGMAGAAAAAWGDRHAALLDAHAKATRRSSRLAAAARSARQWVQMTALGVGAWLVVSDHASPGIMVASTLLLGRALQPLEQLIAGWKQLIEARGAWRRIAECPAPADRDSQLALPARARWRGRGAAGRTAAARACRPAAGPRWATAARGGRAASASASRWPARCTGRRAWWCWTSPTHISTPKATLRCAPCCWP